MRALLRSLAPLIGAEGHHGHAVIPDWAANADAQQISIWREDGEKHGDAIDKELMNVFENHYWSLMRKVRITCLIPVVHRDILIPSIV